MIYYQGNCTSDAIRLSAISFYRLHMIIARLVGCAVGYFIPSVANRHYSESLYCIHIRVDAYGPGSGNKFPARMCRPAVFLSSQLSAISRQLLIGYT
jgi:hypothetical protein